MRNGALLTGMMLLSCFAGSSEGVECQNRVPDSQGRFLVQASCLRQQPPEANLCFALSDHGAYTEGRKEIRTSVASSAKLPWQNSVTSCINLPCRVAVASISL